MIKVVPFIPAHLEELKVHKWMDFIQGNLTSEYGEALANYPSYTAINGKIIACGGVLPVREEKYMAWSLISEDAGKHMLSLTREVQKFFSMFEGDRIEAYVRSDFKQGIKWIEILGFECETPNPMKKWGEDGDYFQYARVN